MKVRSNRIILLPSLNLLRPLKILIKTNFRRKFSKASWQKKMAQLQETWWARQRLSFTHRLIRSSQARTLVKLIIKYLRTRKILSKTCSRKSSTKTSRKQIKMQPRRNHWSTLGYKSKRIKLRMAKLDHRWSLEMDKLYKDIFRSVPAIAQLISSNHSCRSQVDRSICIRIATPQKIVISAIQETRISKDSIQTKPKKSKVIQSDKANSNWRLRKSDWTTRVL